jgi:hypothetical protein
MLIRSSGDLSARPIALRLLDELVIQPIAKWLGPPDGKERAARISVICSGFFLYREVLPLQTLTDQLSPKMRKALTEALQAAVDD